MQRSMRVVCGIGLLSLVMASVASAETAEDVMQKITDLNKKIKSMTADVKTVTKMENEMMKQNSVSDGHYEYVLEDGKPLVRMESTTTGSMEMMGNKQETKGSMLSIMDGEYTWVLNDQDGQKTAMKSKIQEAMDPADPFGPMKENFNVKLLPDETVDGESCYVLEFTPKKDQGGMAGTRTIQYFRKDNGTFAKIVSFDTENKPVMTITYSNVKLNPKISPDRFKFTPPPGVEIMDVTNQSMGDD